METEKQRISNLMLEAYDIGTNDRIATSTKVEAMKAYASLSLALHNMKYC